jgi:NADPH:quinone reductase-like Zn-dependent oxidoreductase
MKAMLLKNNGGPENLILADAPVPEFKPDEVLVRVKAISINPVDAAVRQNKQALFKMLRLQVEQDSYILGWDISGTIVKTGKEATIPEGKDVFGMINFPGQGRAYAEFVAAPADQLAVKPSNISHEEAAAATLAALTAWQALVTHAKVRKGDRVLIHAAAGGVGHYAVQMAKHLGAYVIGTASLANQGFVLGLGANEFIDYASESFEEKVKDADVVLDSINSRDHLLRSIRSVKKGGRLISIKAYFDEELNARAKEKELYTDRILVASNGNDMQQIAALLENGNLKSHISKTYPFNELAKAHQQIETGKTRGKIVVLINA